MERNGFVDNLKGYACFLVLFGHVIMGIRNAGIPIPHFFEGVEQFLWSFHVSLFLFLSGVVYKLTGEWKGKETKMKFIKHKFISLGVPYFVFSSVYIAINSFVGQANTQSSITDIFWIWKTPIAQYWYLYALFFLFVIWTCLSGVLKPWQITVAMVVVGYGSSLLGISLGCFELAFSSALSFGLGTCVDFAKISQGSMIKKWVAVFLHLAAGIFLIVVQKIEAPVAKEVMIVLGIYGSIMLISVLQKWNVMHRFLSFMNKYSFQTYLLHTIFTAGTRIVLIRLHITQWWLHILLGCAGGIFFSVWSAVLAKKVQFLNFFFFPTKKHGARVRVERT